MTLPEPSAPPPARYAVRRNWPDGTHDYFRLSNSPGDAQKGVEGDRTYWSRHPIRPTEHRVIAITAGTFDAHRSADACKSADCP